MFKVSKQLSIPLILFLITIFVYTISSTGEGAHFNYFVLLSDAMIHGRINVLIHPPWLNELVLVKDKYFVVYPPMPALIMVPMVFIFGTNLYQPYVSIFLSAVTVTLVYLVFLKLSFKVNIALWMSILYGFGTIV